MSKPIFRIICNATGFNGGERTAIDIMKLMYDEGYYIELVVLGVDTLLNINLGFITRLQELFKDFYFILPVNIEDLHTKCDILFFLVNDSIIKHHKGLISLDFINNIEAKKRVMCFNYTAQYTGSYNMFKGWNLYICQNEKLLDTLKSEIGTDIKSKILYPPIDLKPFLEKKYDRDYSKLSLIRHSSQGDRKYYDDIHLMVANIYEHVKNVDIHLMPAPSFLYDIRVNVYPYNAFNPVNFLDLGNLFWYFVPPEKFTEGCPRVVLEAMASGVPIMCNENGALNEIVNKENGWICDWDYGFYHENNRFGDTIQRLLHLNIKELKEKGENAREWIKKNINGNNWFEAIIECHT